MTNVVPMMQTADSFELFWKAYPRRTGKPLAKAKWEKITNGGLETKTLDRDSGTYVHITLKATAEELIEGARRYYEKMKLHGPGQYGFVDGGKFICQPATWLNQGRWLDE